MFKLENKTVEALGEKLTVKAISVTQMLAYRKQWQALGEDDMAGIVTLMRDVIKACVVTPAVQDADLDPLDMNSLKTVFDAVAQAAGLVTEKNGAGNKTT